MKISIDETLDEMAKHTIENPSHGIDCVCKDRLTSFLRGAFETAVEWDNFQLLASRLRLGYVPDAVLRDKGIIQ